MAGLPGGEKSLRMLLLVSTQHTDMSDECTPHDETMHTLLNFYNVGRFSVRMHNMHKSALYGKFYGKFPI